MRQVENFKVSNFKYSAFCLAHPIVFITFAASNFKIFCFMDLTLNEMRALKRFAEAALLDKEQTVNVATFPDVANRWETIEPYLLKLKMGTIYNNDDFAFRSSRHIKTLICRLNDLIEDVERQKSLSSKSVYASWLSALAAAVSAIAALVALLH